MDQDVAKKLVQDTLENSFDQEKFSYFINNMLNSFEEDSFTYKGKYIFDSFKDSIRILQRIGKYKGPDDKLIDILVVHLKQHTSLEHARSMQRNFIAKYLKGSRGGVLKDAALVAFVAPDGKDWRFSIVKMEYKFNEIGKIKEDFTPAKRYSFLVGENESSHTAQSRILPALLNDEDNPTLTDLEDIFSVEPVTKEFFENYRNLFLQLNESLESIVRKDNEVRKDFKEKNVDSVDFAKKLLGQIIFLYFLQKKGWFGVKRGGDWGTGPKQFLRELFDKKHAKYKNFFDDILEPLFYEALSLEHADDYYSHFACRIPFLNGGLFDPINNYDWVNADVLLPNEMFSNKNITKEGDVGNGILDVFDRYNFTVKEDEPLEKEVAVDPEMLGKVFENLLEVKDRKSKGTYYTPREIVHYMCQESLSNYLASQLDGKVCKEDIERLIKLGEEIVENDRLVASGGQGKKSRYYFGLGEKVRVHAKEIDNKLKSIRICDPAVGSGAFPVGMMNEIVRARNVLSVYINDKETRTAYNFKRHAIQNCLYGVDIDPGAVEIAKLRLWLSLVIDEEERKTVQPLPNLDYKIVQGDSLSNMNIDIFNNDPFNELNKLKLVYFNETRPNEKQNLRQKIDCLMEELTEFHKHFSFNVYFSEAFGENKGFDVVIANPPYVKKEHLDEKTIKRLEYYFKEIKNKKPKSWSDDLYVHFIFQGVKIAKDEGIVSYITNDGFIGSTSKLRVRDKLLNNNLLQIVRCPWQTFDAAIYTAVFLMQKSEHKNCAYETGCFSYPDFIYNKLGLVSYEVTLTMPKKRLLFASPILEIYMKFQECPKIKDYLHVFDTGIDTGNVRHKLLFKEKTNDSQQRLIQGKQIEKYGIFWDRNNAKYKYCNIDYKSELKKGIGRKGNQSKHVEYWNFRGDIENHHQPERLLLRQSDDDLLAAYQNEKDMGRFYTDNTLFTILPKHGNVPLKYAMAILNSNLLNAIYHQLSSEKGKTLAQVKTNLVKELPFVLGDPRPIVELVDKILILTKGDDYLSNDSKQFVVRKYERQIDKLVYNIYGLTPEEVKIVDHDKIKQ